MRPSLQGSVEYALSETGTLIYQTGSVQLAGEATLAWVDQNGVTEIIDTPGASGFSDIHNLALSPGGRYVAVEASSEIGVNQPAQIWIYDSEQFSATRLTFFGERNSQPRWMPDGRNVAYISSQADGPDGIWMQPFDRTGTDSLIVQADWPVAGFEVAALDGLPMILTSSGATWDLWLAHPGTSEVEPFLVISAPDPFNPATQLDVALTPTTYPAKWRSGLSGTQSAALNGSAYFCNGVDTPLAYAGGLTTMRKWGIYQPRDLTATPTFNNVVSQTGTGSEAFTLAFGNLLFAYTWVNKSVTPVVESNPSPIVDYALAFRFFTK